MTSSTTALELPAPASGAIEHTPRAQPPVRPWVEFLVVGGATLLLFPIAWALRGVVGLDTGELVFGFTFFHAARVLNDPHFAVTYLLFYRDARVRLFGDAFAPLQRLRYLAAGVLVPAGLFVWCAWALTAGSAHALGLMIQLMFLLVGWHYVKQGFGVMVVLSARRGVRFALSERRAILAHCYAGWGYAWANPFDPGRARFEKGVVYDSLPHAAWMEPVALAATIGTGLWLGFVLVRKWRRDGEIGRAHV